MSAVLFYDAYNHRPLAKGADAVCGTVTANCGSFNGCGCFYVFESERVDMVFLRNIPAKLDKLAGGKFASLDDAKIHQINPPLASAILARMFKGVGSHNENLVLVEFSRP